MVSNDAQINTLSSKIHSYATSRLDTNHYIDPSITIQDVQHNLSPILTDLMIALLPEPLSSEKIKSIIETYNAQTGTKFSLEFFMNTGWIRLINETYSIPNTVSSLMIHLDDPVTFKGSIPPKGLEQEAYCLLEVYRTMKQIRKTSIDLKTANKIIKTHNPRLKLSYFINNGILTKTKNRRYNCHIGNNYNDQLKDRIISLAWIKIVQNPADIATFRKFIRFIDFFGRWPNRLADYLPNEATQKIHEFSEILLRTEPDLMHAELEVRNDQLDAESFKHVQLNLQIPTYVFDQKQPYEFFKQIQHYSFYDYDLFAYHGIRNSYLLLIRLLMQFDKNPPSKYQHVKTLLKEHQNPFIRWKILDMIKETFPQILAHFLNDQLLAPLFFELADDLTIKNNWLNKDSSYQDKLPFIDGIRNQLWMEGFHIYLDQAIHSSQPQKYAKGFATILCYLAKKVFSFNNSNYHRSTQEHHGYRIRYSEVLQILGTAKMSLSTHHPKPAIRPLLMTYILPDIYAALQKLPVFPSQNEFLGLNIAKYDVYIEVLRYADQDYSIHTNYLVVDPDLSNLHQTITKTLYNLLIEYLTKEEITVHHYHINPELKKVKRGVGDFGFEILDMAFVFLHFQMEGILDKMNLEFKRNLYFNLDSNQHYEHDRGQAQKVAIYIKLLLTGYLNLAKRQESREMVNYPLNETMRILETQISEYALDYNKEALAEGKHDIFTSIQYYFNQDIYTQPLVSMLYQALNSFPAKQAKVFINQYFADNKDLGKLFTAINRTQDKEIKAILTSKIEAIDPKSFINTAFSINELESALIEMVNSRNLYRFALPILTYVEKHFKNRKVDTPEKRIFLYKIKLLLALKQQQTDVIIHMEVPEHLYGPAKEQQAELARKQFYLGLDQFYNKKNYEQAIDKFQSLHEEYPDNTEYAFYLYHASALKDLEKGTPSKARENWETFKSKLTEDTKQDLAAFIDLSNSMDLLYFSWEHDDIKFDQIINTLPPVYLYQSELIKPIYENYVRRGIPDVGYAFLNKSINYLKETGEEIAEEISDLRENAVDDLLIEKVRSTLSDLRNLAAKHIPYVLPKILNDKKKLEEFILGEIVAGMRVMRKKIRAVESIIKEDHFNDVFLATLRLRLPVFGWEIADQERTGVSESGKDAGESDIVIKAAGQELALLEALKLEGGNFSKLEEHVLKCIEYSRDLAAYYIVVYYHGQRDKFDRFLDTYKSDIARVNYTDKWSINNTPPFIELNDSYENTENIYLAKTLHGPKELKLFHIVIDMSTEPLAADSTVPIAPVLKVKSKKNNTKTPRKRTSK